MFEKKASNIYQLHKKFLILFFTTKSRKYDKWTFENDLMQSEAQFRFAGMIQKTHWELDLWTRFRLDQAIMYNCFNTEAIMQN